MYTIKKALTIFKFLIKYIFLLTILLILFIAYNHYFNIGSQLSPDVNQKSILSVKIGMSEKEVYNILSRPIYYINESEGKFLTYGIPGILDAGAEITLIIKDNKLKHISIESYDVLIYKCTIDSPCIIYDKDDFNRVIPN